MQTQIDWLLEGPLDERQDRIFERRQGRPPVDAKCRQCPTPLPPNTMHTIHSFDPVPEPIRGCTRKQKRPEYPQCHLRAGIAVHRTQNSGPFERHATPTALSRIHTALTRAVGGR